MAAIHIIGAICDGQLNVNRSIVAGNVIIEAQGGDYSGVDRVVFNVEGLEVAVTERTPSTYFDDVITNERGRYYFQAPFNFNELPDGWVTVTVTLHPKIGLPRTVMWELLNNTNGHGFFNYGEPRTIYVHAGLGNDTNDGSEASPKQTLHNAIASCKWANEGNGCTIVLLSDVVLLEAQRRALNATWLTIQGNGHRISLDLGHSEAPGFAFRVNWIKLENCNLYMDKVWALKNNIWLHNCRVTDRGAWHMGSAARSIGGEGTWDGELFTINESMFRSAPSVGEIWVSTPIGKLDLPFEKVDDKTIRILDTVSMGSPRNNIDWGRGFRFLQPGVAAYVTSTEFSNINHGPRGAQLVRNCHGIGQISDFMVEPKCVIATKVDDLHGAESGASFHSDAFQLVYAGRNVVMEGIIVRSDADTQLIFDENSSSTIGGQDLGHDDVWRCNLDLQVVGDIPNAPLTQFCRTCNNFTVVHSNIGQRVFARSAIDTDEDFHPLPGLIAGNEFHMWLGRREEWFNNHIEGEASVVLEAVHCEGDLFGNPHEVGGAVGAVAATAPAPLPAPTPTPVPQTPAADLINAHERRRLINILVTAGYSEVDAELAIDELR
jgi:hypothetical protein